MALAPTPDLPRRKGFLLAAGTIGVFLVAGPLAGSAMADATVPPLATSSAFSVLAGSTVTNVGTTSVDRSVGVSPGTAVTGASTMTVGGTYHQADAVALQAKTDLTQAYNTAAGETPRNAEDDELGGETLIGGVYNRAAAMALTGQLTLDGANNANSVWVFQAGSTLTTASASSIVLINGANPCNVFWQVGSSATLGSGSSFVGTVMADQSITMGTGATLQGRVLARVAAVNLHANVITSPPCSYDSTVDTGTTTPVVPVVVPTPTTPTTPTATTPTTTPVTGTTGTTGNGGGQIKKTPTGGVDTGLVASRVSGHGTTVTVVGWMATVGFGGLALVAVRRRRRV